MPANWNLRPAGQNPMPAEWKLTPAYRNLPPAHWNLTPAERHLPPAGQNFAAEILIATILTPDFALKIQPRRLAVCFSAAHHL